MKGAAHLSARLGVSFSVASQKNALDERFHVMTHLNTASDREYPLFDNDMAPWQLTEQGCKDVATAMAKRGVSDGSGENAGVSTADILGLISDLSQAHSTVTETIDDSHIL